MKLTLHFIDTQRKAGGDLPYEALDFFSVFFSSSARRALAASTDARSAATRSTTFVSPDEICSDSGISTPSSFDATTVSSASRYASLKSSGEKVPDIWSMNIVAMPTSAFDTETSAGGAANDASRTSSGHSIVCITMTSPATLTTASASRDRSATLTTATLPDSLSALRSSTYGF